MIPSQMLKGILGGCILTVISREETYGYEISQKLQQMGFGNIAEGTIYPLLLRLTKNGCICATLKASDTGPARKYYSLTDTGKEELEQFQKDWLELSTAVNHLIGENSHG